MLPLFVCCGVVNTAIGCGRFRGKGTPSVPANRKGRAHMRLRFPRGRTRLVLSAVLAALLVPAAVSAAGSSHGQVTPSVQLPSASSGDVKGGQAPDIYLVQLTAGADTFR